jgi:hypothetical protein
MHHLAIITQRPGDQCVEVKNRYKPQGLSVGEHPNAPAFVPRRFAVSVYAEGEEFTQARHAQALRNGSPAA